MDVNIGMERDAVLEKWIQSADAWIADQGAEGDWSRRAVLDPALERIFADTQGKRVLDLGCGEGRYSRILKEKGALVTGIDPVPQFIELARSLDAESAYVEGMAETLPFETDSFDIVLSYLSMVDITDLQAASEEIARVLRLGGELVIVNISNVASTTASWVKDDQGNKSYRTVDRYMEHFSLDLEWRGSNQELPPALELRFGAVFESRICAHAVSRAASGSIGLEPRRRTSCPDVSDLLPGTDRSRGSPGWGNLRMARSTNGNAEVGQTHCRLEKSLV